MKKEYVIQIRFRLGYFRYGENSCGKEIYPLWNQSGLVGADTQDGAGSGGGPAGEGRTPGAFGRPVRRAYDGPGGAVSAGGAGGWTAVAADIPLVFQIGR